jgi:isocitrate/isopropylmalate dehydrogenase
MMLQEVALGEEARVLEAAVVACVREGETTQDLGGPLGTREFGEAVRRRIREGV